MQEVRLILIIKEVEYAVSILDELYHEGAMSASELSKRRDIPSPFIYRVLKKMEMAGEVLKGDMIFVKIAVKSLFMLSSVRLKTLFL